MTMKSRVLVLLTASLTALPLVGCGNTNSGPYAAAPPPAVVQNPTMPGATGNTIVPGDSSTIAGDKGGTAIQKSGTLAK